MLKAKISCLLFLIVSFSAFAQSVEWKDISNIRQDSPVINVKTFRTVSVDFNQLKSFLLNAPSADNISVKSSDFILQIPNPDGGLWGFKIVEASIMAPELQLNFPEIRTFKGQGTGAYRDATIRLDFTLRGFHAQILLPGKTFYIDPYNTEDLNTYIVYSRKAFYSTNTKQMEACTPLAEANLSTVNPNLLSREHLNRQRKMNNEPPIDIQSLATNGTQLRTYRLALACTGEYAQYQGGSVPLTMSAMTTSMNRVNGIYERDMSLTMVFVANNTSLIYLNGSTDPYTNNDGYSMLGENQTNCDAVIGSANYDIGHVFSTGGGGVASLQSPCNSSYKARGVTGGPNPVGDPFDVDYVAHEMGHQFGANHTFNNSCGGNRSSSAAFEPGSGSTIMGYAGICSPNLQSNSDAYFHNHSFNEMYNFTVGGLGDGCATKTATGNTPPTVAVPTGGFYIPIGTPFELTGMGTDADGDVITYCWEEYDLGPVTDPGDNDLTDPSGNAPIFRSWYPTTNPTRVFPRISDLVNNTTVIGELLPTYSRDLIFRLTVRDNSADGGGVKDAEVAFAATDNSGPFEVLEPNTAVSWTGNSIHTVSWEVANTTAAPVNCSEVDVFLSTDGGYTYPYTLLSNTENDGEAIVVVPNVPTSTARIMVKASENIFFDISNQNFTIVAGSLYNYDVSILEINYPSGDVCNSGIVPEIEIVNLGTNTLTSLEFHSNIDGGSSSVFTWSGTLNSTQSATVSLAAISPTSGPHLFNVTLENPNGHTDQNPGNNSSFTSFNVIEVTGESLPVTNTFESAFPGAGWSIDNPDLNITWTQESVSNDVDCESSNTASIAFYNYSSQGENDDLTSPWIDLSDAVDPELSFDYAYARFSDFYYDRMQVQIATSCNGGWETLWNKENLELATTEDVNFGYIPGCGDWASESINLSEYNGTIVKIRFRGINGWGNNLYLDNINVSETAELDCAGVPGGSTGPGSLCYNADEAGIFNFDCVCETIPLATISGDVDWNSACGASNVIIELYNQTYPELNTTINTTMNSGGSFLSTSFPSGIYDVRIRVEGFLSKLYTGVVFTSGSNTLSVSGLVGGDVNSDNSVDFIDFSSLNSSIGSASGDTNYNPLADFNCDGFVNFIDFSTLNVSFGMSGE